jgi:N-acylneuraminate cytidylyltransferase
MTNILAVIPARGGSKRIPNKNLKKFLGKEIISYPIETLLGVTSIDTVIVSTDSENIKCVATQFGASVPFMRSTKNSDDFATTFDVIAEVLATSPEKYDLVCCVYPTSVFVNIEMLTEAINILKQAKEASSIASVLEYSHPIQRSLVIQEGKLVSNHPEFYNTRSQDLERNFHDAGQFYIFKSEAVLREKRLITNDCIPYVINPNNAQDIDTFEDWAIAEIKYKYSCIGREG